MLGSLIQQGKLPENARAALHMAEYQNAVPFLHRQMQDEMNYGGVIGGLANRQIGQYYFDTARPSQGQGTVIPVSIDQFGNEVDLHNPDQDPMQLAYRWNRQLTDDTFVRGDQRFAQMQGEVPTARMRGIGNSFTRELQHPLTGEMTNMVQFSYIPAYPSLMQTKKAADVLEQMGATATRRNIGNDMYWRNANQSFRYSSRKG